MGLRNSTRILGCLRNKFKGVADFETAEATEGYEDSAQFKEIDLDIALVIKRTHKHHFRNSPLHPNLQHSRYHSLRGRHELHLQNDGPTSWEHLVKTKHR